MSGPSTVERLWRRVHPGDNPLVRGIDRVEIRLMVIFVLLALLTIPVVAAVGSEIYVGKAAQAHAQQQSRTATTAVLLADAPDYLTGLQMDQLETGPKVPARWLLPDGTERTGVVDAPVGALQDTEISIWLDREGRLVGRPMTTADAAALAIISAAALWMVLVVAAASACWVTRLVLNRIRYAAWDREWESIGRQEST